jgi:hypothetical protein
MDHLRTGRDTAALTVRRPPAPQGPAGPGVLSAAFLLGLQRQAGNEAVARLVAARTAPSAGPTRQATAPGGARVVQRPACAGECTCGGGCAEEMSEPDRPEVDVGPAGQRDGRVDLPVSRAASTDPASAGGTPSALTGSPDGAAPLDTAGGGTFTDNFNSSVKEVPIPVRQNAADFNNNLHATLGGDGGRTSSAMSGSLTPTEDANGNVTAATVTWNIVEQVPTVAPVPGSAITAPEAQAELDASNALAARVRLHEDGHATREQQGRTGFAQSLKGVNDSKVDATLAALECKVGGTQRAFDNQEGSINLKSDNSIEVSGVDHPEYVQGC